ncbi:ead/Ea22-like family protein [Buttiauxella gaviniae]|uniref:ead/Ea22-like family protein n=1 Tax=Buttiauxella gaviniae TaxID=82990 RepID=UPI0039AFCAC4
MDKGIEALREAVRRAPLTKPEGLSPAWQAYFDAVTPLHVAELIATLEQAQQECQAIEQKLIKAAVYIETLESEPRQTNLKQLNEIAELKRKCVGLPDEFARIGENLRTQDNRITSHPVFVVFQKEEMVVSEEFDHDRIAWVWECGDGEVEDRTARRLEALHQGCRDTRGYSRYAMKSIKRFVTACFTEDGCKDYLRQNGHNLNEPFIYVDSAYRNDEWQVIRNWLMTVGGTVEGSE